MVGGTCGAEAGPVSYFNELYSGDLAVVWFDAHGDLNTPETSPSGHFHGMVLRTLLGEGASAFSAEISRPLVASQVFLVGTRDLDAAERSYISDANIPVFLDLDDDSVRRVNGAITGAGFRRIYIHID